MKALVLADRFPLADDGWQKAMMAGIKKSGDHVQCYGGYRKGYDAYIMWGIRRPWFKNITDRPKIIVEQGFLGDRTGKVRMVGLNGLNGMADYRTDDVPTDRWGRWRGDLRPWKHSGEYALIMGQKPRDSALHGLDIHKWIVDTYKQARKYYDQVYFRPHPEDQRPPKHIPQACPDFDEAVDRAKVVITYTSNAGVLAVMRGVPTISMHKGSMVYSVTSHSLDEPLYRPCRDDWGRRIAYSQWEMDEIADGLPWRHLTRG